MIGESQPVLLVVVAQAAEPTSSPGEDVALRRRCHAVHFSAGRHDDAGAPKVRRVHQRKHLRACRVAVAELAVEAVAARVDSPPARHRQRVTVAAGHEHDARVPKHRQTQARRAQPVLGIAVPQLAGAVGAAGQDRMLERGDLGPPVAPGGQGDQLGILKPPSVAS
jgi:hypothetical protein